MLNHCNIINHSTMSHYANLATAQKENEQNKTDRVKQ